MQIFMRYLCYRNAHERVSIKAYVCVCVKEKYSQKCEKDTTEIEKNEKDRGVRKEFKRKQFYNFMDAPIKIQMTKTQIDRQKYQKIIQMEPNNQEELIVINVHQRDVTDSKYYFYSTTNESL